MCIFLNQKYKTYFIKMRIAILISPPGNILGSLLVGKKLELPELSGRSPCFQYRSQADGNVPWAMVLKAVYSTIIFSWQNLEYPGLEWHTAQRHNFTAPNTSQCHMMSLPGSPWWRDTHCSRFVSPIHSAVKAHFCGKRNREGDKPPVPSL